MRKNSAGATIPISGEYRSTFSAEEQLALNLKSVKGPMQSDWLAIETFTHTLGAMLLRHDPRALAFLDQPLAHMLLISWAGDIEMVEVLNSFLSDYFRKLFIALRSADRAQRQSAADRFGTKEDLMQELRAALQVLTRRTDECRRLEWSRRRDMVRELVQATASAGVLAVSADYAEQLPDRVLDQLFEAVGAAVAPVPHLNLAHVHALAVHLAHGRRLLPVVPAPSVHFNDVLREIGASITTTLKESIGDRLRACLRILVVGIIDADDEAKRGRSLGELRTALVEALASAIELTPFAAGVNTSRTGQSPPTASDELAEALSRERFDLDAATVARLRPQLVAIWSSTVQERDRLCDLEEGTSYLSTITTSPSLLAPWVQHLAVVSGREVGIALVRSMRCGFR